jgi:hypothetical protein
VEGRESVSFRVHMFRGLASHMFRGGPLGQAQQAWRELYNTSPARGRAALPNEPRVKGLAAHVIGSSFRVHVISLTYYNSFRIEINQLIIS